MKELIERKLKDNFANTLQYLDSKRDRDVLEAIVAKMSSVKSVVSIKGEKFKGSVSKHRATLNANLKQFEQLKYESQTVRNDMTVSQQNSYLERQIKKLKQENQNNC